MLLVAYFTSLFVEILLFCHETEPAVINPDSKPINPVVKENHNITLSWTYTLSENIGSATFTNVARSETIASKFGVGGKTDVLSNYQQRFRAVITNTQAQLSILSAQRSDHGKYQFQLQTSPSANTLTDVVELTVQFSAEVTKAHVSPEKKVRENSTVQLICEASGEPIPNITWAKVLENGHISDIVTVQNGKLIHNITNINRSQAGKYRCTANNGMGQSDHKELEVEVLYPAKVVSLPSEYNVSVQQNETLVCQAEGMPKPSVSWTPCAPSENVCNQSQLNIQEVLVDGVYTCKVKNDLGTDSANTSVFIAAKDINVTLEITSESCENEKYNQSAMLSKRLNETISKIFANYSTYRNTAVRSVSCGSLFVDLTLTFSVIVKEQMVLSILKEAAKDGKLGAFSVDPSSIVGTRPIKPTTSPPVDKTTTSAPTVRISTLVIVLIVVGVILFLVIIVVVVICCIRMKKKKESKEVNDDKGGKDVGSRSGPPPGAPGQNNTGYEEPGYASTSSAARTKKDEKDGKKSSKKKDAQREEIPMYAQVDKSKKKPKPNSYSEVERPDRREPEIQYAVMDHSHPGGSMPRGAAIQPRRAPETVYADLV